MTDFFKLYMFITENSFTQFFGKIFLTNILLSNFFSFSLKFVSGNNSKFHNYLTDSRIEKIVDHPDYK